MEGPAELLRQGKRKELWLMCCSFIDLNLDQFMGIQKRLLLEQIELLKRSSIGRKVMQGAEPGSVEEFRERVPLTTYADYVPDLQERREYILPARPDRWVKTSGYSGTYDVKWVPWSKHFTSECEKVAAACAIFAMSRWRGDTSRLKPHLKILYTVGGPDYASGAIGHLMQKAIDYDFLPSGADALPFTERIKAGFAQALDHGLDAFGGLPSVLVSVGEQMLQQPKRPDASFLVQHPRGAFRLARGLAKSRLAGRQMMPKDLWDIKAILGGGTDAAVYKKKVEAMWGRKPLELYGGTEGGIYAVQTWDYAGMTFVPNLNFFEFISEEELLKWRANRSYQPRTVLLDEVEPGHNYEVVITNLHGGALVRFRLGDMISIASRRNEHSDIDLPQMVFYSRADYVIDIAGLGRLTERIIWEALENTAVPYVEWTARKEIGDETAVLHLYLEPKPFESVVEADAAASFARQLRALEERYHHNPYRIYDSAADADAVPGSSQVKVSLLPPGAFGDFVARRQAEGADLGHLKPPHIEPSPRDLALLSMSGLHRQQPVAQA
jgi:hypothetical protein